MSVNPSIARRSSARLSAVQALYQMEMTGIDAEQALAVNSCGALLGTIKLLYNPSKSLIRSSTFPSSAMAMPWARSAGANPSSQQAVTGSPSN